MPDPGYAHDLSDKYAQRRDDQANQKSRMRLAFRAILTELCVHIADVSFQRSDFGFQVPFLEMRSLLSG